MSEKMLFANISYCFDGEVGGQFRYIREKNDATEKHNFEPMTINGEGVCWGFFEPGFTKGGYDGGCKQKRPSLEKNIAEQKIHYLLIMFLLFGAHILRQSKNIL